MMNDVLSDCTAAAAFHIEGVLQANAGRPQQKFSNAQVVNFYSQTTGYDPRKPGTDQGGDESTVLDYWRDHGLYKDGHQIAGHATVDATDWDLVCSAAFLFENTYFGMSLPNEWIEPFPAAPGWTWDVAGTPNNDNGHAVAGVDMCRVAGDEHIPIASWGMTGKLTKAAVAKYAVFANGGELHTVFSYDAINKASLKSASGFKADELYAEFQKQFPEASA